MNSRHLHIDKTPSDKPRTASGFFFSALRIVLGLLFCTAGISKLFILNAFSDTIRQVMPAFASVSPFIAVLVIGIEIACGAGLALNAAVWHCTIVLGLLTTVFLYILAIALVSKHAFICRCFGIIPLSFSNAGEFIFNLCILDALFLLYYSVWTASTPLRGTIRWTVFLAALFVLYGEISIASFLIEREVSMPPVNLPKINAYLSSQQHHSAIDRDGRHIILLRLSDFNCPPCFEDFVGTARLLQHYGSDAPEDMRVVGLIDQTGSMSDTLALQAWKAANDISFPLFLVPDSLFLQFNCEKSCVVHQQPYGRVRFVYSFPGNEEGRKKLFTDIRN